MLLTEFLNILDPEKLVEKTYSPVSRPPQAPKKHQSYIHKKYDLSHLGDLINGLETLVQDEDDNDDDDDDDEKYGARYLVDLNKRIIFTREGRPGKFIPKHKEIAGSCLAAGTLFFNKNYSKIVRINNSSGDFHPEINSLIWPLAAILAVSPERLNDEIIVQTINEQNESEEIIVPKEKLQEILSTISNQMLDANTPWSEIKIDEFNNRLQNRTPVPNIKRMRFFSSIDTSITQNNTSLTNMHNL